MASDDSLHYCNGIDSANLLYCVKIGGKHKQDLKLTWNNAGAHVKVRGVGRRHCRAWPAKERAANILTMSNVFLLPNWSCSSGWSTTQRLGKMAERMVVRFAVRS